MFAVRAARYLAVFALVASVAGCTVPTTSTRANSGDPEKDLRTMSSALQRTILEGASTTVVVGPGFYYASTTTPTASGAAASAAASASVGALAGAYVGWLQQEYASQEERLEQIRTDLERNSDELQTTIDVMKNVLALQNSELDAIRARAQSGAAAPQELAAEVSEAQANLNEMQRAIRGASVREQELKASRGLVLSSGGGSQIDPELQALAGQLASMRAIATDLSENLG